MFSSEWVQVMSLVPHVWSAYSDSLSTESHTHARVSSIIHSSHQGREQPRDPSVDEQK